MNVWHMRLPTFRRSRRWKCTGRCVRGNRLVLSFTGAVALSDIRHFIGNRRIGMVVVDEGAYGKTPGQRVPRGLLVSGALFGRIETEPRLFVSPVCPDLPPPWNPKGGNDMVFDTIRSLQMEPCILYVGTVRRKNIGLTSAGSHWKRETTTKANARHIRAWEEFLDGHKALLYYPFAGGIDMRIKTGWLLPTGVWWPLRQEGQGAEGCHRQEDFKEGTVADDCCYKSFRMGGRQRHIDRVYHAQARLSITFRK